MEGVRHAYSMTTTRYTVHDSQATAIYPRNTPNQPRYWVLDTTTNRPVDEFTNKRAAQLDAKQRNTDEEGK